MVEIKVDLTRLMKRIKNAQAMLDSQVMIDMTPLMPRQTGQFVQLTKARSASLVGKGIVYAGAPPYGHFLHTGKVMIDPVTRSTWARRGVKKIYTDRDLKMWYPTATSHWFDVAKQQHVKDWVNLVRKTVEGKNER